MITRRAAVSAGVAAPWLAHTARAAEPPTLEALLRAPTVLSARLSPDGARLAVLRRQEDGGARLVFVDILDAGNPRGKPVRVPLGDIDATDADWANNERLLISLQQIVPPPPSMGERGQPLRVRRLATVGIDGKGLVMLGQGDDRLNRANPRDLANFVTRLADDPAHVVLQARDPDAGVLALFKVDVATGAAELLERGSPRTIGWRAFDQQIVLRLDRLDTANVLIFRRASTTADWELARKMTATREARLPAVSTVARTDAPGVYLGITRQETDDTVVLRPYDITTGEFGAPVAAREGLDVDGVLTDGAGRLVATRYITDRVEYDFVDPALAPHHRAIDRFLRNEAGAQLVDCDRAHARFVVRASGPRVADAWYVYDRNTRRMEAIGLSRPWLSLDSLAPGEAITVKARDGASFGAYLTQNSGAAGPRPLVVLPHDGPERRDTLVFSPLVQALAARGWLVLQPNFRGSGGFGRAFATAGQGANAGRPLDDIDDAVAHVLAAGRADKTKVAILGFGYGGYAALMGAVRQPELYRAAVSIGGFSDPDDLLGYYSLPRGPSPALREMQAMMGPPRPERSPRARAAEIRAPVLLVHDVGDTRTPPAQSRVLAQAMRAAGRDVQLAELDLMRKPGGVEEGYREGVTRAVSFIARAFGES